VFYSLIVQISDLCVFWQRGNEKRLKKHGFSHSGLGSTYLPFTSTLRILAEMKYVLTLYKLFIALFLFYQVGMFCHRQTDGFTMAAIQFPSDLRGWEQSDIADEQIRHLLAQRYTFLGSGGQFYAFASEDGNTVLKLFKMSHLYQFRWLTLTAFPGWFELYRQSLLVQDRNKLERCLSSCSLASHILKPHTGVLFQHTAKTKDLGIDLRLIDRLGIEHRIAADRIPFLMQKKAEFPFLKLRKHIAKKELKAGKEVVRAIVEYLQSRYQLGIRDTDPALRRNTGLLDGKAIAIDVGSFVVDHTLKDPACAHAALVQDTLRTARWLQKRSPELSAYLKELIQESQLQSQSSETGV